VFGKYDTFILIGEPYCLSNWVIIVLSRILKKKTLLWSHGWYGSETNIKKIVKKIFFNIANYALLYGDYARNQMISEGIKEKKLFCFYNSLDYDLQLDIRNRQGKSNIYIDLFGNSNPVLIYVGRLQKVKRLDMIISAISNLKLMGMACNLVIVGKEIEELELNKQISELELEANVHLFGECYDENKLGELFYNSDICVSPGNVGLTAIHSLMYGTPVITNGNFSHQMPEFEAIKDGETGCFFKENDLVSMSNKIFNWLNSHKNDRDLIRVNAYKVIDEKYNPNYQIRLLKNILNIK
jgi:glycosyltransferase involved in cell wall biosynthesis